MDGVASGQIKALIALGENPLDVGITAEHLTALPVFVVMDILSNEATTLRTAPFCHRSVSPRSAAR